jgi:hypothetical protein
VLIGARGTEPQLADALTDLDSQPTDWSYEPGAGVVHHGFLDSFNHLVRPLAAQLASVGYQDGDARPVYLTGHSLGGAIASLMAAYILSTYRHSRVVLYTYGQPRTFGQGLPRLYWRHHDSRFTYHRIMRAWDPVPMVPRPDLADILGEVMERYSGAGGMILRQIARHQCPPEAAYRHFGHAWIAGDAAAFRNFRYTATEIENLEMMDAQRSQLLASPMQVDVTQHFMVTSYIPAVIREFNQHLADYTSGGSAAVRFTDTPYDAEFIHRLFHQHTLHRIATSTGAT